MVFTALTFSTLEVLSSTKMNQLYGNDVYLKDTVNWGISRITPQKGSYYLADQMSVARLSDNGGNPYILATVNITLTVASKVLCLGTATFHEPYNGNSFLAYLAITNGTNTVYIGHSAGDASESEYVPGTVCDILSLSAGANAITLISYCLDAQPGPVTVSYRALNVVVLGNDT